MRIRRTVVFMVTLLAVLALAGPASAGGQPRPAPGWLGPAIVVALLTVGTFSLSVIAFGIAQRRRHR